MYTFYILKNPQGKIYKGYTNNLPRRLKEHNNKHRKGYASQRGPWKLVYKEVYQTKSKAMERERYFKTGQGREELKSILKTDE